MERSYEKRITIDAQILRHMRISRMFSLKQAGRLVGISGSAISHIEQGRMDISKARRKTLLRAYEYTMDDFLEFCDGKPIPKNLSDECHMMLRDLSNDQLQIVHALIRSLVTK